MLHRQEPLTAKVRLFSDTLIEVTGHSENASLISDTMFPSDTAVSARQSVKQLSSLAAQPSGTVTDCSLSQRENARLLTSLTDSGSLTSVSAVP